MNKLPKQLTHLASVRARINPGIRPTLLAIIPYCSHVTQKCDLKQSYADKPGSRPGQYYKKYH